MAAYVKAVRVKAGDTGGPVLQGGEAASYLDRVKAYIPTQAVTAYALLAAYDQFADPGQKSTFYIVAALLCFIGSGLYIYRSGAGDPFWPRAAQALIAMLAFIVWAYAVNVGIVNMEKWYNAAWSTLALVAFTFAFGTYQPKVKVE